RSRLGARSLQPKKIEKRKANAQIRLRREIESSGDVRDQQIVGPGGNAVLAADTAASVAKKEPAHDGNSAGLNRGEVGGDSGAALLEGDPGVAPGRTTEVRTIVQPGIVHGQEEVGIRSHR